VSKDAELTKSSTTESAAALLATTLFVEFADNAPGMKSTIKDSESAEFLVMLEEFSISASRLVFAYHNFLSWLTEPAPPALSTQLTTQLPSPVFAIADILPA
jgi:hypothetical protein